MGTKLNGIVLNGKFYRAVRGECKDCDLRCGEAPIFNDLCNYFEDYKINQAIIFRYSQELTDKLNKT